MSAGLPGRRLAAVLWTAGLRRGITVPPGYRAVMQRLEELPDSRMPLIFITAMYPVRLAEAAPVLSEELRESMRQDE